MGFNQSALAAINKDFATLKPSGEISVLLCQNKFCYICKLISST